MKTELHLHTTRYSGCAVDSPERMMTRLVELGYEACFITEHDQVWLDQELDELRAAFPQLQILPGMELTIDGAHLLVLGSNDPALLHPADPWTTIALADQIGCMTILAHPFRWEGGADLLIGRPLPDALEHRTPNHDVGPGEQSLATAKQLKLPVVNSGDAHSVDFLGRFWIETNEPFETAGQLRTMIRAGQYANCCSA